MVTKETIEVTVKVRAMVIIMVRVTMLTEEIMVMIETEVVGVTTEITEDGIDISPTETLFTPDRLSLCMVHQKGVFQHMPESLCFRSIRKIFFRAG